VLELIAFITVFQTLLHQIVLNFNIHIALLSGNI